MSEPQTESGRASYEAMYLNLVSDWGALMDYLEIEGDSTASDVIAILGVRAHRAESREQEATSKAVAEDRQELHRKLNRIIGLLERIAGVAR